jgi:hypothetical protein
VSQQDVKDWAQLSIAAGLIEGANDESTERLNKLLLDQGEPKKVKPTTKHLEELYKS